jgi:hypothetical protein
MGSEAMPSPSADFLARSAKPERIEDISLSGRIVARYAQVQIEERGR